MEYKFTDIEKKWQTIWKERHTYRVENHSDKPKYYVLDMFPYPSGAGLHVGHPLGFIATDIVARYKRLAGFNVLHPMGFDSFGLPAEQYAIQTGQHPEKTTKENIKRYIDQMNMIGFSFDWDREVRTSDPSYYKWTQWIFLQIFKSWYNCKTNKAEHIDSLISIFESQGFSGSDDRILTGDIEHDVKPFTAAQWKSFSEKEKSDVLMHFRLAYLDEAWVNWCPQLGTVLANDEVKDGVSERGGFPVERKRMPQWSMRITSYADRLINDLDALDWTESMKEAQRNWIGRSEGTSLKFQIENTKNQIEVFTTRPDTIFGVTFVTLAPEHELVSQITTDEYKNAVDAYITAAKSRSERERMAEVKKITGQFTGAYVIHPFTNEKVPVWIGDYVLAGYGTGAVMAVPAHDSRDYAFAKHFDLPIKEVVSGGDISKESYDAKEGKSINSDFLNGLDVKDAVKKAIAEIEKSGIGKGKINYRLRDAAFGRQRYWGEPIPIYYKDGIPCAVDESDLPIVLPQVDKFLPTESGEPPLARAKDWVYQPYSRTRQTEREENNGYKQHEEYGLMAAEDSPAYGKRSSGNREDLGLGYPLETTTMPGWAGSSWYYLRYMDPDNDKEFVSQDAVNYWKNVDLYLGGAEHATGHLLYVRFWTKFLFDMGLIPIEEPAKKLINQGMIQGTSMIANVQIIPTKIENGEPKEVEYLIVNDSGKQLGEYHFPVEFVEFENGKYFISKDGLEITKKNYPGFSDFKFDGVRVEFTPLVEKMSKSKYNVVTPDLICDQYGADTLRLYEMFLGPLEQHKPWNTNGITGVFGFLKKLWRLFYDENGNWRVVDGSPNPIENKILHKTLKKVKEDIERYSFNTCVSAFMIAVNELQGEKCYKRSVLADLLIALSPFAPHICEELWSKLKDHYPSEKTYQSLISKPEFLFPTIDENALRGDGTVYPVQINGKKKFEIVIADEFSEDEIKTMVLEEAEKWLEGKTLKKVIVVPKRIVNIVAEDKA